MNVSAEIQRLARSPHAPAGRTAARKAPSSSAVTAHRSLAELDAARAKTDYVIRLKISSTACALKNSTSTAIIALLARRIGDAQGARAACYSILFEDATP